jgi:hypothetical protein
MKKGLFNEAAASFPRRIGPGQIRVQIVVQETE